MKSLYSFFSSVNSASNVKLSESLATNPTENLLKKFILRTAGVVALFLFLGGSVWGQTQTPTATVAGNYFWVCPTGVTSITVSCYGGGGGGGRSTVNGSARGGGGGGAYASSVVTVVPGTIYSVVVGAGGAGGNLSAVQNSGGNSTFGGTLVVAAGGGGVAIDSNTGGNGGTTAASTGTIKYSGGNGAASSGGNSGGGGGGGGSANSGGSASGTTAGTGGATGGGNGGAGITASTVGNAGQTYGGGGSGGRASSTNNRNGGAGAAGAVVISYTGATSTIYPVGIIPSSTADEDISNVTVGSLNNSSNCATAATGVGSILNRYANYCGVVAAPNLTVGSSVNFSLTMTTCGGNFTNFFQIYIDYNNDGDFADTGEQVYSQGTGVSGNQTATGSFTIPAGQAIGTCRMRVLNVEASASTTNYTTTSFGTTGYGEVEDYLINFIAAAACSGTPAPGNTTSTAAGVSSGGTVTLGLQNATSGTGLTYQWQSGPSSTGPWTNFGTSASTQTSPALTSSTWFRCNVTCGANTGTSAPVQVSIIAISGLSVTTACPGSQVTATGNFPSITGVTVNSQTAVLFSQSSGSVTFFVPNTTSGNVVLTYSGGTVSTPLTIAPAPKGILTGTQSVCSGSSAQLTFNSVSGTGPFTLTYLPSGGSNVTLTNITNGSTISVSPITNTTYEIISLVDANGCTWDGNLVVNPDAKMFTNGWTLDASGGSGWATFTDVTCFGTSYSTCLKSQVIDLATLGYSTPELNAQPEIYFSDSYTNNGTTDKYGVRVELQSTSNAAVSSFANPSTFATFGTLNYINPTTAYPAWSMTQNTFNSYGTGVSKIKIQNGGYDGEFWIGYYGIMLKGTTLKVKPRVTVLPLPTASVTANAFSCANLTASFSLTGTSGANVSYSINNGATQTATLTGGAATSSVSGVSTNQTLTLISVTNPSTNCVASLNASATVTITEPACASSLSPADNATNQSANGIVLSWASVTCATGYDVYVNDVLVSENQAELAYSTGTLTALSSYTWKVVPRNGNVFASGCSTLNFTTSTSCTPPTFTVESANVSCFGQSTGSITISASGGQSPLSYSIDGGNTYPSSNVFTSLPAGTYSVVVKGSDDCLAAAQAVTISQPTAVLEVTASGGGSGCEGSTLSLSSSVSGGTSPYTYSWTNAAGLSSGAVANPTATIGSFDSHTLTVTDANLCTATSSAVTITNNSPAAPTVVTPDAICQGQSANLNATSSGNGINWYSTSTGGTVINPSTVASGVNYVVTPASTLTYYAEATSVVTAGSQTFNYSGSIVTWTVPVGVTSINVDARGAQGGVQPGTDANYGGRGARILSNNISVTPGQVLNILVGQAGTNGLNDDGCGGGGGSFLTTGTNVPLVVAGGGGGDGADSPGRDASTSVTPSNNAFGNAGGTSTNGGLGYNGGGGAGLTGNGGNGVNGSVNSGGGSSFTNGGNGGLGLRNGGFGGGGAGSTDTEGAGGGGGYAGGAGGNNSGADAAGGGSSYSIVTPSLSAATQTGNGQIIISWNAVAGCSSTRTPVTVTVNEAPTATAGAALSAICQGQTSAAMGGSIGGTATSGTWSGGAGTWTNANDPANATYTAGASESGTITLTLTPNGGSCPSVVATKTIVVNANPNFTVTPSTATICSGSSQALSIGSGLSIPNYNFASSTGTYTAIAGGNTSTATGDDAAESAISIGFNFYYRGIQYNQFGVSTNGIIQLGSSTTTAFTNALASTTDIIAPFWDDNNSSSGSIKYSTTGTSPNRVLTVEWLNVAIGGSGATGTSTNNFQVKLFETTNVIQMLYGAGMSSANSLSGSIGISGAAGSYLSVTPGSTPTVSSSAENSGISSVANLGSGTIYTFSPQYSVAWTPTSSLYSDVAVLTAYNSGSLSAVYAKPTITTTYTATATSAAGCTSSSSATVTVNQPSVAPTALSASTATICNGGSTTLTQTGGSLGTGAVWQWYSDANFTTTVGATQTSADASLSVSPTTTSTYYLRAINGTSPCAASVPATTPSTVSVTVTVSQPSVAPTSISGTTTICNGASTALTAVGATLGTGATYEWGTGSTVGSSPIAGTGSSITVSPTATTSYWVRVTGTTSPCATTTDGVITSVTVNALPTAVTVSGGGAICAGTSATLTADNGISGTIYWQNTTSGGTSTATPSASQSVSAAGTYYFRPQSAEGCWGTEGSATVTVTSLPSTPVVTVVDNCDGTSELSTTATGTLAWSNGASTTPVIVSTAGTYTVTQTANGCTSAAGSGVAAPKSTPATPSITVTNSCGQSTLSFTPAANATILWINNATTSSTTTTNTETLTVVQTVNGCPSAAGSGSAVPLVIPSAPTATASQNFCVTDNATVASLAYTSVAGNTYTWYDAATAGNTVPSSTELESGTTTYYLSTTGSNGCTSTTRTAISATEAAQVLATVEISGTTTCPGGEITFTATPSNGGNSPTYQWYNGGVPILNATGNTYIATGLAEGAVITVKMIPSGSCVTVCPN